MAMAGKGEALAFPNDQWESLYRQHYSGVVAHVRRKFGPGPPEPEEVAQAVLAKFPTISGAESVENPGAYLSRMASNYVLETHRRNEVTRRVHGDVKVLLDESRDFTPEDIVVSQEELSRLDFALGRLKSKQRIALLLHRIDGLSFATIGRELDMSPSGARRLVETAHKACIAAMRRSAK